MNGKMRSSRKLEMLIGFVPFQGFAISAALQDALKLQNSTCHIIIWMLVVVRQTVTEVVHGLRYYALTGNITSNNFFEEWKLCVAACQRICHWVGFFNPKSHQNLYYISRNVPFIPIFINVAAGWVTMAKKYLAVFLLRVKTRHDPQRHCLIERQALTRQIAAFSYHRRFFDIV